MSYEYFYPGTKYTFESPIYGSSTAYAPKLSEFGITTDARTAAQIQEISNKLNTGVRVVEMEGIQPDVFDAIPKQQLKEINRLTKLTGTDVTLHGPLIEASGYTREGWSEVNRMGAERQMKEAVERAHELDPNGNIPVTFHSTAALPEMEEKIKTKEGEKTKSIFIVDPRTGRYGQIKEEERFFPGQEGEFDPKKELERENKEIWVREVGNINFSALRGEQEIEQINDLAERRNVDIESKDFIEAKKEAFKIYAEYKNNPDAFEKRPEDIKKAYKDTFKALDHGSVFLKDSYRSLRDLYNMAYKEANPEDKKKLNAFANEIKPFVEKDIDNPEKLEEFAEIVSKGVHVLDSIKSPAIYKPLNEFVMEKSAQTFASAALHGYKKFGEKAPIVSIENPPAGGGFSRGEDIKKLVEKARSEFVEIAKKEGLSASEAKNAAEKLIGATWDVGHINMLRKYGYEEKDIVKQTEKVAPLVKHVHLSDNFGYEHTELPMGMGNVPIKEILEKLGKEGFKGKKIIEAMAWWQHVKQPPLVPTLEAFGSPLYPMLAGPTWTQASATYGNYFAFPSGYFPEQHFSLYGGGFSQLPQELGGQIPGKQSRMSGTPMD